MQDFLHCLISKLLFAIFYFSPCLRQRKELGCVCSFWGHINFIIFTVVIASLLSEEIPVKQA